MGWKTITAFFVGVILAALGGVLLFLHSQGVAKGAEWAGIISLVFGVLLGLAQIVVAIRASGREVSAPATPDGQQEVNNTVTGSTIGGNVIQAHTLNRAPDPPSSES